MEQEKRGCPPVVVIEVAVVDDDVLEPFSGSVSPTTSTTTDTKIAQAALY